VPRPCSIHRLPHRQEESKTRAASSESSRSAAITPEPEPHDKVFALGLSLPKWAVCAMSGLPQIATELRTSLEVRFVPTSGLMHRSKQASLLDDLVGSSEQRRWDCQI
jgi:hypothetical protein